MNFFNIDLHISVIADIKKIFKKLGHNVDDKCLSGHAFVMGRQTDTIGLGLTNNNWQILLNKSFCDRFYDRYKDELKGYDGFICTYPPSFALLYEKFNKPIIIQAPIRFEAPFQNKPDELKTFIDFLQNGIDNKQIIPICNSLYEKKYCEKFTDREWKLIPNICDYTNINCMGTGNTFLLYSRQNIICNHNKVMSSRQYLGHNYTWSKLNNIAGAIHLPYNISTMSIFEQYTGNIPLLFPTPEFIIELYNKGLALTEISWNHNKLDSIDWIKLADFYNEEWMPYIQYFESFNHLEQMVNNANSIELSNNMRTFNYERKEKIYNLWKDVLNENFSL